MIDPSRDDAAFVSALRDAAEGGPWGWCDPFRVSVAAVQNHQVDIEIDDGTDSARVWVALPSSLRPMPWMVFLAPDPHGWVSELADWLSEEVDTVGLGPSIAVNLDAYGHRRAAVAGYGLKRSDAAEHSRLQAVVGPRGWTEDHGEHGRSRIRRAYALEWALDEVERLLSDQWPASENGDRAASQRWSLVSSEGFVIAVDAHPDGDDGLLLTASTRVFWRRQGGRRRLSAPDVHR